MKLLTLLFFCLVVLSGCDNAVPQTKNDLIYFDVASYVNAQIQTLSTRKPMVAKNAILEGQNNHQLTQDIDWANELELFMQSDINKPALRNSYTVARPDSFTYEYTLKPTEEKLTVRELTVRLDPKTRKPTRLTALLKTENPLYTSERNLLLESGPSGPNTWGIWHYRVEGFQQLTYFDRSEFRVDGTINQ